jgi:hypothetical protein
MQLDSKSYGHKEQGIDQGLTVNTEDNLEGSGYHEQLQTRMWKRPKGVLHSRLGRMQVGMSQVDSLRDCLLY